MPLIAAGAAFPWPSLPDLDGRAAPLPAGLTLVVVGHRNCKTTREVLPYVDRIAARKTRGSALAVLQDTVADAREVIAELGLTLPVRLEADPYPLAAAVGLETVPTLFLLDDDHRITRVTEAFRRADLEAFAEALGVAAPLFAPDDRAPAFKPG